jgi:hypothetical protein
MVKACDSFVQDARAPKDCHLCGFATWQHSARAFLSDNRLLEQYREAAKAFDASQEGDGHGGSPGEWAYERCLELEGEIKRRGMTVPETV